MIGKDQFWTVYSSKQLFPDHLPFYLIVTFRKVLNFFKSLLPPCKIKTVISSLAIYKGSKRITYLKIFSSAARTTDCSSITVFSLPFSLFDALPPSFSASLWPSFLPFSNPSLCFFLYRNMLDLRHFDG